MGAARLASTEKSSLRSCFDRLFLPTTPSTKVFHTNILLSTCSASFLRFLYPLHLPLPPLFFHFLSIHHLLSSPRSSLPGVRAAVHVRSRRVMLKRPPSLAQGDTRWRAHSLQRLDGMLCAFTGCFAPHAHLAHTAAQFDHGLSI
eukprot:5780064-Pleurochrysis_carterae.AAC.1